MRFAPVVFLSVLLHLYVGTRIVPALAAWPWAQALFALVLVASAACMPLGLGSRGREKSALATVLTWAGLLFMGLFSSLFVLTLLRDVALLLAWIASAVSAQGFALDAWRERTAAAVPLLGLAITAAGFLNARRRAAVVTVDVPIEGLPAALDGFTIAQISDIHVGPTIRKPYLQAIVDAVNGLKADMVAITGDLVDGTVAELGAHVAPLSALASRHGTFFVTGNHEYYSGAHAWIAELRRLGVTVLMNEHVLLRHGAGRLLLAGVADYGAHQFDKAHRSDPQRALVHGAPGAPPAASGDPKVLLAHQPRSAAAAEAAGFDLQLSGHTHGGQFLPWNFFVRLQQPFTAGLHKLGKLWVYTSRGTGYWGPPKRFGAPSEITRLRLVAA